MTLIKSISGIRGTIGGEAGNALTPLDIVKFTYAFCATLPQRKPTPNGKRYKIVVGKDARLVDRILDELKFKFKDENIIDIDGVKINFDKERKWVHLRKSNTEPIIRIYSEAPTVEEAERLGDEVIKQAQNIICS